MREERGDGPTRRMLDIDISLGRKSESRATK